MANPNHDERGRFSSGSGGGGKGKGPAGDVVKRTSDARGKDHATSENVRLGEAYLAHEQSEGSHKGATAFVKQMRSPKSYSPKGQAISPKQHTELYKESLGAVIKGAASVLHAPFRDKTGVKALNPFSRFKPRRR